MAIGLIQRCALGGTAVALALSAGIASAEAGGFAPHEQSTYFLGTAFAGTAAGGALSSMFWNPAAAGQFDGFNGSSNYSLIMPDTEITATGGALYGTGSSRSSGDIAAYINSDDCYRLSGRSAEFRSHGTVHHERLWFACGRDGLPHG